MSADAIVLVDALRHRVNGRRSCRCEECRAITQVVVLAREAIAMKAAQRDMGFVWYCEDCQTASKGSWCHTCRAVKVDSRCARKRPEAAAVDKGRSPDFPVHPSSVSSDTATSSKVPHA